MNVGRGWELTNRKNNEPNKKVYVKYIQKVSNVVIYYRWRRLF